MDHEKTLQYISETRDFSNDLSLKRVEELSRRLADPWQDLSIIHIAGTNGKGSISSYISHILCTAGYKVGWYTSPYLERFNERIRILEGKEDLKKYNHNNRQGEISDSDIDRIINKVKKAVEAMQADNISGLPSEFDLITMMAFIYFKENSCDFVVAEAGLGGRLDSTNVIKKPLAAVIAAPGFDHTDRLGNSMREIMSEKAGIVKENSRVYAYDPRDAKLSPADAKIAKEVLEQRCQEKSADLTWIGSKDYELISYNRSGQRFRSLTNGEEYTSILLGRYQPINALIAANVCQDYASSEDIKDGIAETVWPARMEILSQDPFVLLDGAHNLQACLSLKEALSHLSSGQEIVFLSGMMRDKEINAMLATILRADQYDIAAAIFTEVPSERSAKASEMLEIAENIFANKDDKTIILKAFSDHSQALAEAISLAKEKDALLCIFGSLYLAGAIRRDFRLNY